MASCADVHELPGQHRTHQLAKTGEFSLSNPRSIFKDRNRIRLLLAA